jgi:hypothetical protein
MRLPAGEKLWYDKKRTLWKTGAGSFFEIRRLFSAFPLLKRGALRRRKAGSALDADTYKQ